MNAKSRSDMRKLAWRLSSVPQDKHHALASAIIGAGLMRSQWWMRLLARAIQWRQGWTAAEAWAFVFHHNPTNVTPLLEATADWIVTGKDASGEGVGGFNQAEADKLVRMLDAIGAPA